MTTLVNQSRRDFLKVSALTAGALVLGFRMGDEAEAAGQMLTRRVEALLDGATNCDAVLTSGGVSMGDYDVVKAVLGRIADMTWMQIAIKPAKPFAFGTLDGTPIFGLPGNPVSSIVSYEMLARPALRRMMGHRRLARPSLVAVADEGADLVARRLLARRRELSKYDRRGRRQRCDYRRSRQRHDLRRYW